MHVARIVSGVSFTLLVAFSSIVHAAELKPPAEIARPSANVAAGKPYSLFPAPNYSYCTDPDDIKQLTDGQYTRGYFWTQKSTVGWQNAAVVIVTVDLQRVEPIRGASFNTAAGVAGVAWPAAIDVLVSDDGKSFYPAGNLVELSERNGRPPEAGYAVHRYWTDNLHRHGRYVAFVVSPGSTFAFVDEVEVYRGDDQLLSDPPAGQAVTDLIDFHRRTSAARGLRRRILADVRMIREMPGPAIEAAFVKDLDEVVEAVPALPQTLPDGFRAELPLNELHRRVLWVYAHQLYVRGWRSPEVAAAEPWDPVPYMPPKPKRGARPASLNVTMMSNEHRAAAMNVTNPERKELEMRLHFEGLPGVVGGTLPYVSVHEVPFTDTRTGEPTASALPLARREGAAYVITIPSGLTRQVWFTFHPTDLPPGTYTGNVVLDAGNRHWLIPTAMRVSAIRFPDQPALHLGGFDYTDVDRNYDIATSNRDAVIAHLREHCVDSPWATAAVLSHGRHDPKTGAMLEPPDTAAFDRWRARWPGARQWCVFASVGDGFDRVAINTPQFEVAVKQWITFWAGRARAAGTSPSQLIVLLVDEPHEAKQDARILAWAKAIRAADTGVTLWEDATHADPAKADQAMMAAIDVLCPNRPMFLENKAYHDYFVSQRPASTRLNFYSCSGPVRSLDPYAYHRLQAWTCWAMGADGEHFWAFGDSAGASSWNEYATARPAFVPFFLAPDSVTPGKHMEAIREGVEDYQYLLMLREAVASAEKSGSRTPAVERARKLLAEAPVRVLDAEGAAGLLWNQPKDRTTADRVRIEILDAIESLAHQ